MRAKIVKTEKNLRVESSLKIYWIKKSLTKHALGVMNVKYLIEKLFLSWQHLFSIYFFDESQSDYVLAGGRNRSSVESSNWEWQAEIFHGRRKTHTQFSLIFKKKMRWNLGNKITLTILTIHNQINLMKTVKFIEQ